MRAKKPKQPEFWITNISKRNVSLRDLRLSIPARSHMNLLDKGHFKFTIEELKKSAKEGSLFLKKDKIKVRETAPVIAVKPGLYQSKEPLFLAENPELSQVRVEEKIYEELQISDEQFAEDLTKEQG